MVEMHQGGPIQGQMTYFGTKLDHKEDCKSSPISSNEIGLADDQTVATNRFKTETLRTYGVIELQLSGKYTGQTKNYLAGKGEGKYSVADIGAWRKFSFLS